MTDTSLTLNIIDHVAHITLNRPEKRNALNKSLLIELKRAFLSCRNDSTIRAVLLTGAGKSFCAGADLSDPETLNSSHGPLDLGSMLEEFYNPLILTMQNLPKPIVVAVNGAAAGAGMSLALGGDIIVAGKSASFLQAFARLGLVPDMGSTWLLPRLIGRQRAMSLALLAEPLSADKAEEWGLIHAVYEDDDLLSEAHALVQKLSTGPTVGYGLLKQALHNAENVSFAEQLNVERAYQREASQTKDFMEGVSAFLHKRSPSFTGS